MSDKRIIDYSRLITTLCVCVALLACVVSAHSVRPIKTRWPGVAPAPSEPIGLLYGFGDRELSYYVLTLTLQNMGDMSGNATPIKDYNMQNVADWLWLTYKFDRMSRYAPILAGYYFGATQDPSKLRPVIDYLGVAGNSSKRELWRYLAQAVYLARFRLNDQALGLDLAYRLAALYDQDHNMPLWTRQMPAFVLTNIGQKQASRDLYLTLLASSKTISIQEVNSMCAYVTDHLREPNDGLDSNEVWLAYCANRKY